MLYLLETAVGVALFKKEKDIVLLDKYLYKNPSITCDIINSMNNSNSEFSEEIDMFFKRNLMNYSTLNILNPELVSVFNKKYQIKTICKLDKDFERIRTNPFKWFEVNKDLYNAALLRVSHKLLNIKVPDFQIIESHRILMELDKSINNRVMRIKEWYSLHFPELAVITDTVKYLNFILCIGNKFDIINPNKDTKQIAGEDISDSIVQLAENSMGIEMKDDDLNQIKDVAKDILKDIEYNNYLNEFMKEKCNRYYPSLYNLIGESLIGKLLNKTGTLLELSRLPSSTIQILGAEKAFNEAIKNQKNTPKYGIIFESKFISRVEHELKGKVARFLANKISLCSRVDLEENDGSFGKNCYLKISKLIEKLEAQGKKTLKPIKQQKRKFISIKEYHDIKESNKKHKLI